jgi:polyisoprenoid-binding protein YceI
MYKKAFIGFSIFVVVAILGIMVYVLRPTAQPSTPVTAIPVEIESTSQASSNTQQAGESSSDPEVAGTSQPTGITIYTIVPEDSEVRFILDELLRGQPTTVIGATNQVSGEIAVDFTQPGDAKVGTIMVNARTLTTDNDFRNRAINNEILKTRDYEFITFTPTLISGFPVNPSLGEALNFQISGDLTIRDITQEVTFDVQVTAESETRMVGSAAAVVARDDFGLEIPSVPQVADVDENVRLEIDFIAER